MNSLFSATLDREENIIKLKKEVNALLLELNREQQYEI